ncbi:MAG: hypothetical protein S0880_01130 [Actinomycetota bacterium]|nr:hypothetical protein [Actinomycetota bacterium]
MVPTPRRFVRRSLTAAAAVAVGLLAIVLGPDTATLGSSAGLVAPSSSPVVVEPGGGG